MMIVRHFKRGQRIFRVNDKDNIAYFILAGKVELYQEEPANGAKA
jgi:CRP-like cAMP-binding protein